MTATISGGDWVLIVLLVTIILPSCIRAWRQK